MRPLLFIILLCLLGCEDAERWKTLRFERCLDYAKESNATATTAIALCKEAPPPAVR